MEWESLYCPNRACRYYGIPFYQGLMVKNGSSHGQKQALCRACRSSVSLRYGTVYWTPKTGQYFADPYSQPG